MALVQVCGTTPCMLRGADELMKVCKDKIGPQDHVSTDGQFYLAGGRVPGRLLQCADGRRSTTTTTRT